MMLWLVVALVCSSPDPASCREFHPDLPAIYFEDAEQCTDFVHLAQRESSIVLYACVEGRSL